MTNDERLTVSRTIDASTKDIFDVLTLPSRHQDFDGSGMVRADEKSQRIQAVGDVFVMNMNAESMGGDYQMFNTVTAYAPNERVGWQPAQEHNKNDPDGWEWVYELNAVDANTTEVTLIYDWSKVEDPKLKSIFPAVSEAQLEESLNLLAAAVSGS